VNPQRAGRFRPDLAGALAARLRRTPPGPLLAGREAVVAFCPDRGEAATVELHHGRLLGRRGAPATPATATVRGSAEVLSAVLTGADSGVRAFLAGDITVRGDLALALALDGLFNEFEQLPDQWPRASQVTAHHIATAYLDAGPRDARPLVLLHGLGATNASLLPLLWNLAEDYRVIAPDLPGFGASAAPRGTYSAAWFMPWLRDFCRQVGATHPVLIGNSLGGRIALEAGLTRPDDFAGLVLLCPAPAFRRLRQWVPVVRVVRPGLARVAFPVGHRFVVGAIRTMFAKPDRLPQPWYDSAADEFLRVNASPAHRVAFFATMRAIYLDEAFGDRGFWTRLPSLTPPALFVWGDRDRLVPASFARHVDAALPGATSVVLEDSGHVPQFEHPARTAALVREFLASLPA